MIAVRGDGDGWVVCDAGHRHRTLEGVGHFPHQEAPQHVTDALLDFLDE